MSAVLDDVALEGAPEVAALLSPSVRLEREGPVVLAFDVRTSGLSAGLFDSRGDEIEGSQVSLSHEFLAVGTDSNADDLIDFVESALYIAVARAESFVSRIDYVAASSFLHTLA